MQLYRLYSIHYWASISEPQMLISKQRCLHSASSLSLTVHRTQLSTISDWAFPAATACTLNSLPKHLMPALSMFVSRGCL